MLLGQGIERQDRLPGLSAVSRLPDVGTSSGHIDGFVVVWIDDNFRYDRLKVLDIYNFTWQRTSHLPGLSGIRTLE